MKTSVENLSAVERKIVVEVEPERVQQEVDQAYRTLGRRVKVQGFRPGKAPRHVLAPHYKAQIEAEVIQGLVEKTYREVIAEQKLDVVGRANVSDQPLKPGEAFHYEARVEVRPVIALTDFSGIEVKRGKHEVTPALVDEEIEKVRRNLSKEVDVTDRTVAQKGDLAVIDFEATIDGKPFAGNRGTDTSVEVTEGEFVRGEVGQVEGMTVGAEKTFDYTFPADFRIEEAAGKTAQVKLTLKSLKVKELPALDDALAKESNLGQTLDEMRAQIEKGLTAHAKGEKDRETRTALVEGLIARNPFECPNAMIDRAVEAMVESGVRRMSQQGIDVAQMGLDFQKLGADLRPKAEQEVRASLLLDAVAAQEKIEPTQAQFEAKLAEIAAENEVPVERVTELFKRPEQREGLMGRLREEQTLALLESKAKIEET